MAWAIFTREFNWRRPKSRFSFNVKPSPAPQSKVHDLVEAAVAAGAATRCKPPPRA
jgi:hypothetical protein